MVRDSENSETMMDLRLKPSNYRNVDRSGRASHRADRSGKVPMVALCGNCHSVAYGHECEYCHARLDGYGTLDVRQGSVKHIRAILARLRAEGKLSEDTAAETVAEMLGVE